MNADEAPARVPTVAQGRTGRLKLAGTPPKLFLGVVVAGTLLIAALALSGARPLVIVTLVAYVLGLSDPSFRRAEVSSLLTRALYALLAGLFVALLALATWP